jgi:hypothetical protein
MSPSIHGDCSLSWPVLALQGDQGVSGLHKDSYCEMTCLLRAWYNENLSTTYTQVHNRLPDISKQDDLWLRNCTAYLKLFWGNHDLKNVGVFYCCS